MLVEVLGQITVGKPPLMVVPLLEELLGDNKPQEEPAPNPAIFLTSSFMVLLLEESIWGLLAEAATLLGFPSPITTPTSAAPPPLLFLTPVPIFPVIEPSSVQLPMPEAGPSGSPFLVSIPLAMELLGPLVMIALTGMLQSSPSKLTLAAILVAQMVAGLLKGVTVLV